MKNAENLINEKEAAAILGIAVKTMQLWRQRGKGPDFIKLSYRCVRYSPGVIAEYIDNRQVSGQPSKAAPPRPGKYEDLALGKAMHSRVALSALKLASEKAELGWLELLAESFFGVVETANDRTMPVSKLRDELGELIGVAAAMVQDIDCGNEAGEKREQ